MQLNFRIHGNLEMMTHFIKGETNLYHTHTGQDSGRYVVTEDG